MEIRQALTFTIILSVALAAAAFMAIASIHGIEKKQETSRPKSKLVCFNVKILDVTDSTSLLEVQSDNEIKNRMLRDGNFGRVGEVFNFCENDD